MSNDELNHVEAPAIEQLKSLGWTYVEGEQLSPDNPDERGSFREVALINRLETSIKRINPWINEENLRKVIKELTKQPLGSNQILTRIGDEPIDNKKITNIEKMSPTLKLSHQHLKSAPTLSQFRLYYINSQSLYSRSLYL